jgi:hypothetical protein
MIASEEIYQDTKPTGWMMRRLKKGFFMASAWPSMGVYWFLTLGAKWDQWTAASLALLYAAGYTLTAIRAGRVTKLDYGVVLFWAGGLGVAGSVPSLTDLYFQTYFTSFLYLSCHSQKSYDIDIIYDFSFKQNEFTST